MTIGQTIDEIDNIAMLSAKNAALRRRVEELRKVLALVVDDERKFVEFYRTDVDEGYAVCNFCKSSHMDEYQIDHHPKCPIAASRTTLARTTPNGTKDREEEVIQMKDSIDREHQVEELARTVIRLLEAIQEISHKGKPWHDIPSVKRKVERARATVGLDGK